MKIIFLGTSGWYDNVTGATPCIVVDSNKAYIIFDAGNGIYKLGKHITDTKKPIFLFLSHLHFDHIFGLHILNKFNFPQGMVIVVPKKLEQGLETVMNQPYTIRPEKLKTKTTIKTISSGNRFPFSATSIPLFHSSANVGYRVMVEEKTIAYSGDAGICDNSIKLADHADILIHECSFSPGYPKSPWGHSCPEDVATLAKEANVKKAFLTHFDPNFYPTIAKRKDAEKVAQSIFPNSHAVCDDEVIEL